MATRRDFNSAAALAFGGLALASCGKLKVLPDALARAPDFRSGPNRATEGFGRLLPDPHDERLLDLPEGFSYEVISSYEQPLTDGLGLVPDSADGMGSFSLGGGRVALVRNHELDADEFTKGPDKLARPGQPGRPIEAYAMAGGHPLPGGTTTIIYDYVNHRTLEQYRSLAGTIRNCAGGVTPWGTWLTCEEDVTDNKPTGRDHGWVFEVPAGHKGPVKAEPLREMGRFKHEAAAVDPRTGIVYLTEDQRDGLFYRFVPHVRTAAPDGTMHAKLAQGGTLQALALAGDYAGVDARNWSSRKIPRGVEIPVTWIDLEHVDSPRGDDLRKRGRENGATRFANAEGIHFGLEELYFCVTSGGAIKSGQIMRYRPSMDEGEGSGTLELFLESDDPATFNFGDNLVVAPNGHLVVCEDPYWGGQKTYLPRPIDSSAPCFLRGVTPDGAVYNLARLHKLPDQPGSELAGACFSPDGKTLFVNVMSPTKTLAITASDDARCGQVGPWGEPLPGWKVYDAAASV